VERCLRAQGIDDQGIRGDVLFRPQAADFYRHYGFVTCQHTPQMLYLPLGT
jgi:hypothetical protein